MRSSASHVIQRRRRSSSSIALYGNFGLWVRPVSMWNETVERDGKTFRRFTYIGE